MNVDIVSEATWQMASLPYEQQDRALEFIKGLTLSEKSGAPGGRPLKYAGFISPNDLKAMSEAIENDCTKTDANEW